MGCCGQASVDYVYGRVFIESGGQVYDFGVQKIIPARPYNDRGCVCDNQMLQGVLVGLRSDGVWYNLHEVNVEV